MVNKQKILDANEFINDISKQLSDMTKIECESIIRAILMGVYTQGYRDANMENNMRYRKQENDDFTEETYEKLFGKK